MTASPNCPYYVRRTIPIAKAMQTRCVAATLGVQDSAHENSDGDANTSSTTNLTSPPDHPERQQSTHVGQRSVRHTAGAGGIKTRNSADFLLECTTKMIG